jgi:hypothetical protein
MVEDLRRQGAQLKPQTCEEMQERDDPWGNRDATSMFKEVGDSAETKYDNDMYVASKMARSIGCKSTNGAGRQRTGLIRTGGHTSARGQGQ